MLKRVFALFAMIAMLLVSTAAFADYERTADNTVPAYQDPGLTNRTGNERVDAGDRVIVHEETGNAYRVTYPTPRGSKTRWVPKNVFNDAPAPSGDVQVSLNVGLLKQNDSRWANEMIRSRTIAARGCTITSLAMTYNYLMNANITPVQMRDALQFDGNSVIWSSVQKLGFATEIVGNRPSPDNAWLGKIYNLLKAGRPVIVGAYRAGDNQHWVVVKGYTGNSTSNFNAADFQINDPMNPFTNLQQFFGKYNLGLRGIVY